MSCIGVTVVGCMCMEWTTGPNAKTYRAFSRRPGFAATKQQTRPWRSMWSVARFDRKGEIKYSSFCKKMFGEIVGKGSARDGLVLENNERLPLCTPFLSRALHTNTI
jgi:hypothetical protein